MKIRRDGLRNVLLGSLLLIGAGAGVETASAQGVVSAGIHVGPSGRASVDLGFFYDDLAPYGNWIERPSYGWVWTPRAVASSWRPYQNGHWVATDEGWVWVTDEPYGWATYHYGRWYEDPELGWSWVPGDTWGPSWVSFQEGNDYVGWAPLPPGVNVSVGFSGGGYGGYAYGIAPAAYLFVPERNFLSPRLGGYYVGRDRIGQIWGQTRNFTSYRFQGGRVFNQGVPIDRIQRFGRVPRYQVTDVAANFRQRGGRLEGNRLAMFRPQIQRAGRLVPPNQRPAARRAVVSAAQFRAAHGNRVAVAQRENQRLAAQAPSRQPQRFAQQQQRQQRAVVQREARTAQVERQRVAQTQRQARVNQVRNNVRNNNEHVAQRQAQANRQMERRQLQVNRQQQQRQAQASRQQQQRQFQASRQQERRQAQVNRQQQQRQFQVSQQRGRGAQQRQVQMARQQQRQFAQQQRQNRPPQQANPNRGGGPGRQQGRNNNRQRPPGPGGQ